MIVILLPRSITWAAVLFKNLPAVNQSDSILRLLSSVYKTIGSVDIIVVVGNYNLQQVQNFQYLGCDIVWDPDRDVENKFNKFQSIRVILQRILTSKIGPENKIIFLNVLRLYLQCYSRVEV